MSNPKNWRQIVEPTLSNTPSTESKQPSTIVDTKKLAKQTKSERCFGNQLLAIEVAHILGEMGNLCTVC